MAKLNPRYERKYLLWGWKFNWDFVHLVNDLVFQIAKRKGLLAKIEVDTRGQIKREQLDVGDSLEAFRGIVTKKLKSKGIELDTPYDATKYTRGEGTVRCTAWAKHYLFGRPVITLRYILAPDGYAGSGVFSSDKRFIKSLIVLLHEGAHLVSYYYSLYQLADELEDPNDIYDIFDMGWRRYKRRTQRRIVAPRNTGEAYMRLRWKFESESNWDSLFHGATTENGVLNELWAVTFSRYALLDPACFKFVMERFREVTNPELIGELFGKEKDAWYPFQCERDIGFAAEAIYGYGQDTVQEAIELTFRRFRGAGLSNNPKTGELEPAVLRKMIDILIRRGPKGINLKGPEKEKKLRKSIEFYYNILEHYGDAVGGVPRGEQMREVFEMAHNYDLAHKDEEIHKLLTRSKGIIKFEKSL